MNYITFMISVFVKLLFSSDKRPVMTHTTPPTLAIFLSMICFLKRRKFIQILLDIFPEGLIRLGKLRRNNLLVGMWNRLFIFSLNYSDRLIVIGRDMKTWIAKYITDTGKIYYVPLWHDDELITPLELDENEIVEQYSLKGKFIVQYSGNMGLWNDMRTIGKAVMLKPSGVLFMFIGNGMRENELLESFYMEIPENVLMLPFQPKENFRKSITACHASIVSLAGGLDGMAVPSKIYGIMAAGIPVIAVVPQESEIAMIVQEEDCGIVVCPGDLNGLINAIVDIQLNEDKRKRMGSNGRKAFEEKYAIGKIASRYKTIICET
jgi:glycosyltransferase involved in cell wall biosynthesis